MNRRTVLKSAATLAAASGLSPLSRAAAPDKSQTINAFSSSKRDRSKITSTLAPWNPAPGQWDTHTIGHLYRRAGFGATMAEIAAAKAKTPAEVIDALLDNAFMTDPRMPGLPYQPANMPWHGKLPYLGGEPAKLIEQQQNYFYANLEIRRHWAVEMAKPETMLREKMALFWMNHFVVEAIKVYYPQLMYGYLDYFRHNAWGNFKEMTKDVTIHSAMLYYLDGYISHRLGPNENYARELLELFTVGVTDKDGNPNYTEEDIRAISKALTGYRINTAAPEPNVIASYYDPAYHDSTFKTIFDTSKQWGLASAGHDDDVIEHIFVKRPDQIAWFICSKLYQYFVYNDITGPVERGIIDQMATTFKSSNWDVRVVLAELLKSEHFFDEENIGAAIKSPYEHVVGMSRQFDIPINRLQGGLMYYVGAAGGQVLLDPPNVKGWPGYRTWVSTTTLPYRNLIGYALTVGKAIPVVPAGLTDYYGNPLQPIDFNDTALTNWAKQFPTYTGDLQDFIDSMATFLCAQPPTAEATKFIVGALNGATYEWSAMNDTAKLVPMRQLLNAILSLADYQLA